VAQLDRQLRVIVADLVERGARRLVGGVAAAPQVAGGRGPTRSSASRLPKSTKRSRTAISSSNPPSRTNRSSARFLSSFRRS
jgi:hypothetical protein